MKSEKISELTTARLSVYLRCLNALFDAAKKRSVGLRARGLVVHVLFCHARMLESSRRWLPIF